MFNQRGEAFIFLLVFVFGMSAAMVEQEKLHKQKAQKHYDAWHEKEQRKEKEAEERYKEAQRYRI